MFEAAEDPKTKPNQFSRHIDAIRKAEADVNAKNANGVTPLHYAAWSNENPEVLTLLIKAGADVNAKNEDGWTPLDWAVDQNNTENAEALRAAGGKLGEDLP